MNRPVQTKLGLSFLPTLQYSSTPEEIASVPANPLHSGLAPGTRFSMSNKDYSELRIVMSMNCGLAAIQEATGLSIRAKIFLDLPAPHNRGRGFCRFYPKG